MSEMSKFYSINENVILNEVETQGIIFYQSESGEKIYYLNDTSLAVIQFLQGGRKSSTQIVNEILCQFEVSEEECKADIENLLRDLERYQVIDVIV